MRRFKEPYNRPFKWPTKPWSNSSQSQQAISGSKYRRDSSQRREVQPASKTLQPARLKDSASLKETPTGQDNTPASQEDSSQQEKTQAISRFLRSSAKKADPSCVCTNFASLITSTVNTCGSTADSLVRHLCGPRVFAVTQKV